MDCWSSLFSYENGKLIKHRNKTDYEIDAANSHYTEARWNCNADFKRKEGLFKLNLKPFSYLKS